MPFFTSGSLMARRSPRVPTGVGAGFVFQGRGGPIGQVQNLRLSEIPDRHEDVDDVVAQEPDVLRREGRAHLPA